MKKSIVVIAALALSSCAHIPAPQPALVAGDLPAKVQTLQLSQSVREQLGAREKGDVLILAREDGSVTLFGAPGLGFSVEKKKDDLPGTEADRNTDSKPADKGVVSRFMVTMTRNSPVCGVMQIAGHNIHFFVPDCPH